MIPTPDLSHIKKNDFDKVYEPAEDTFLLLDALEEDDRLIKSLKPCICLEIGSGSGCVITLLSKIVGEHNALFLTTDINDFACKITKETGLKNNVNIESIRTSLVNGLLPRLKNSIDILCFNPPYVVTTHEEVGSTGIEASWAGGIDGREVIDQLLPYIKDLLSPKGIFYLLLINENKPEQVINIMKNTYNMKAEIRMQRRAGRERQFIIKIQH
ncbi:S-adenosyl-L-methionine-dependent methyltransferase [Cokeromyces recurvatus]|uniref:S-adenosyl-L-methionine-dependent methyltransferase n=1 Tax=Cokeromyces recurvatus TaxID=90255 RepID=UPI0022212A36|nr:S-adenosyl-L-methionine-dependent methyltransferase [Cokeromyces recurvatus]KAI7907447.1 S-adenosyl-L-methionine-dependent methyltransferase [Cokeromyces recurvatus]